MNPPAVERVLLTNKANYLRPRLAQRLLSPLVGNGLLSAEGEDWRNAAADRGADLRACRGRQYGRHDGALHDR